MASSSPRRTAALLIVALITGTSLHAQVVGRQMIGPRPTNLLVPARSPAGYSRALASSGQYPQQYVILAEPKWGTGFGVEGFAGQLQFKDTYNRYDQDLAGGLAGLYLGQSLRLRGFYWHGVSGKDSLPDQIESFGGEVQMGLFSTWFIHPFILGGGGRINYLDGYQSKAGDTPESETTWIGGAGILIRPLDWLDLNVTWRDYLLQSPLRDTWLSNSMWTAGLSIRFGGTPRKQPAPAMYGPGGTVVAAGAAGPAAGNVATFPVPAGGGEIRVIYNGDSLTVGDSAGTVRTLATGLLTGDAVKTLVSAELSYLDALYPRTDGFGTKRGPLTPEQADTLARRLGFRTNEVVDYVLRTQLEAIHDAMKAEMTGQGVDQKTQALVLAQVDSTLNERARLNAEQSRMIRIREDSAYARRARDEADADRRTVSFGTGGFSQWFFDGRISFRSPWTRQLRLMPEAAVGFLGGGVSALVAGNAQYVFTKEGSTRPYVGLGLGVLVRGAEIDGETGTSFVVNPAFGVEYSTRSAQTFGKQATAFFFEAQGVDLFQNFRLVGGVTWKF